MKSESYYETMGMNYINGNISDFKRQLNKLTKRELMFFIDQFQDMLGGVGGEAREIVTRYLTGKEA